MVSKAYQKLTVLAEIIGNTQTSKLKELMSLDASPIPKAIATGGPAL